MVVNMRARKTDCRITKLYIAMEASERNSTAIIQCVCSDAPVQLSFGHSEVHTR